MSVFKPIFSVCLLVCLALLSNIALAEYVSGEIIVKFKQNVPLNKSILKNYGVKLERKIQLLSGDFYVLHYNDKFMDMGTVLKRLNSMEEVQYAEPNYIYKLDPSENIDFESIEYLKYTPTDPRFSNQWGLNNTLREGVDINIIDAWDIIKGSKDVLIAVIDTGIDYNHPDLKDNIWINTLEQNGVTGVDDDNNGYVDDIHGYDFAYGDGDPMDGNKHGTHCAGVIGAVHDSVGIAGVMAKVSLVGVKMFTDGGSTTAEKVLQSIDYATKLNVDVMSNSWGGGDESEALREAITKASEKGIVFVAAAGNSGKNNDVTPHFPSSYEMENVVSVASHNKSDNLSSFSCYGKESVDMAAPGESILSTVQNGRYMSLSGTSMATPHVSGIIGLYISKYGRTSHSELKEKLIATSVPHFAYKKTVSGGRINAYNLLMDIRPVRPYEPLPTEWQTVSLEEPFESPHPYEISTRLVKEFVFPGAKMMRLVINKLEIEFKYDYILVENSEGRIVDKIMDNGERIYSEYVYGDKMKVIFHSDSSKTYWGFLVEEIQVITEF